MSTARKPTPLTATDATNTPKQVFLYVIGNPLTIRHTWYDIGTRQSSKEPIQYTSDQILASLDLKGEIIAYDNMQTAEKIVKFQKETLRCGPYPTLKESSIFIVSVPLTALSDNISRKKHEQKHFDYCHCGKSDSLTCLHMQIPGKDVTVLAAVLRSQTYFYPTNAVFAKYYSQFNHEYDTMLVSRCKAKLKESRHFGVELFISRFNHWGPTVRKSLINAYAQSLIRDLSLTKAENSFYNVLISILMETKPETDAEHEARIAKEKSDTLIIRCKTILKNYLGKYDSSSLLRTIKNALKNPKHQIEAEQFIVFLEQNPPPLENDIYKHALYLQQDLTTGDLENPFAYLLQVILMHTQPSNLFENIPQWCKWNTLRILREIQSDLRSKDNDHTMVEELLRTMTDYAAPTIIASLESTLDHPTATALTVPAATTTPATTLALATTVIAAAAPPLDTNPIGGPALTQ